MATYDKEIEYGGELTHLKLKERYIYGSSRVGVRSTDIDMLTLPSQNYSMKTVKYDIGGRTYELSNHLGNVLSVVSDKVIPSFDHGVISGMLADIRSAQDYSPFGVTLSGRNYSISDDYRFAFNGMEKDDEVKGNGNSYDFGARMYDSRLGRWLSIDPLAGKYPGLTPYQFSFNCPTIFKDPDGKDAILTVDKENKTVTLETTVYLYGVDAVRGENYAKYHNEGFAALSNSQKVTDPNDPNAIWTVNFKINYVYDPEIAKELEQQLGTVHTGLPPGSNGLRIRGGRIGGEIEYPGGNKGWADGTSNAGIHETFHFMGFDERYVAGIGPIAYYWNDVLSAAASRRTIEIMKFHFVDLLDFSLQELPNGGSKILGGRAPGEKHQVNIPEFNPVTGVQTGGRTEFIGEPEIVLFIDHTNRGFGLDSKFEKSDQKKIDERIAK